MQSNIRKNKVLFDSVYYLMINFSFANQTLLGMSYLTLVDPTSKLLKFCLAVTFHPGLSPKTQINKTIDFSKTITILNN